MDDSQHLDLFYHTCYSIIRQTWRYWITFQNIQQLFSVQHTVDDKLMFLSYSLYIDRLFIKVTYTTNEQSVNSQRYTLTFMLGQTEHWRWHSSTQSQQQTFGGSHAENTLVLRPVRQNGKLVISFNLHSGLSVMARDWAFCLAVS